MRKSYREKLSDQKRVKVAPAQMDLEGMLKMMLDEENRPPARRMINPTQAAVLVSKSFINFYKGPAGCAKTSTGVAAVLMRLMTEPGSKGLIARQDYNDLKGTTMERAVSMRDRLPPGTLLDRDKSSPERWFLSPIPYRKADGSWDDRPSELRFMSLKEGLGSYDYNIAFLDEADEVDPKALEQVITRTRTKSGAFYADLPDAPTEEDPYAKDTKGYYQIILAFNPPEKTHWLYTACTGRDHQETKIAEPKGRLFEPSPRENVLNLPSGYYERLTESLAPDQKARYVDGEWGATFPGTPAIRTFIKSLHCTELEFEPLATLYRFWDFGYRHPFCFWVQVKLTGQMFWLREHMGKDQTVTSFAKKVKMLTALHYPEAERVVDIGDIAVKQKKDTGSALGELWREGIKMMYQPQSIERGLKLLRNSFREYTEDNVPMMQIDRRYCQIWIGALTGGYHMDDIGAEPVKDGFYDHSMDAARYGIVGVLEPANLRTEKQPLSVEYDPRQDPLTASLEH